MLEGSIAARGTVHCRNEGLDRDAGETRDPEEPGGSTGKIETTAPHIGSAIRNDGLKGSQARQISDPDPGSQRQGAMGRKIVVRAMPAAVGKRSIEPLPIDRGNACLRRNSLPGAREHADEKDDDFGQVNASQRLRQRPERRLSFSPLAS